MRLKHLPTIDSTNAEAMRLLASGERGPVWILADQQTAGRGRSGRSWSSKPGNLFSSYLTTFPSGSAKAYQVALISGVAIHDAIRDCLVERAPAALQLKWPNDVLVGREKTGGILVESTNVDGKALALVIGIGLNLVSHPIDEARPATHLGVYGGSETPTIEALLAAIDHCLTDWLAIWSMGQGFGRVRQAWLARAHAIGSEITVNASDGPLSGRFAGLDDDGALLITVPNGQTHTIHYGDVTLSG
jgi:BirA family transcriptional regulator, biotin operon repressor / biotin---[acetyl-CoA-carboxylase] ligase